ncbi:Rapid alkalinization factor [Heracleum sosnowskyi]|uniref:Rapid alkalinization factor n=1 Tax=Heracleum sosnowskyi TaxID=360622 RepID=A0AAD8GZA1_9APIA|nr:Rapid alkalinization factor [Heracleum sosnowskyi]
MAPSSAFHFSSVSALFLTAILVSSSVMVAAGGNTWMPMKPLCTGSVADCMGGDEFNLDSESNRRILATTNYISYDALERNNVPCSQRGASYYNCEQGAEANPYDRGCSAITRCRS